MSKISAIEHLKAFGEGAKTYAKKLVGELAQNIVAALEELNDLKANKPKAEFIDITPYGWYNDGHADYPEYYEIMVDGITDTDRAEITIVPECLEIANACGMCPTNETFDGIIKVRAKSIPQEEIWAECWIENGKE